MLMCRYSIASTINCTNATSAGLVTSLGKLRECIQQHGLLRTREVRRDIKRRTDTKRGQCGGAGQKEGQLPKTTGASMWTRQVAQAYAQVVKEISPAHSLISSIRSLLLLSAHMPLYEEGGVVDQEATAMGEGTVSAVHGEEGQGQGAFVRMWSL
jgi:hypothetical protein